MSKSLNQSGYYHEATFYISSAELLKPTCFICLYIGQYTKCKNIFLILGITHDLTRYSYVYVILFMFTGTGIYLYLCISK